MGDSEPSKDESGFASNTEKLLAKWATKYKALRDGHYAEAARLHAAHYRVGVPSVIVSTLVGTSVAADLQQLGGLAGRVVLGLASVIAAMLAGLVTFMRYSERAEVHRKISYEIESIVRDIEAILADFERVDPKQAVEGVQERLERLEAGPPLRPAATIEWSRLSTTPPPSPDALEAVRRLSADLRARGRP